MILVVRVSSLIAFCERLAIRRDDGQSGDPLIHGKVDRASSEQFKEWRGFRFALRTSAAGELIDNGKR